MSTPLTLLEYLIALDLGLGELLRLYSAADDPAHALRMAPNSALCFTVIGTAVIFSARNTVTIERPSRIALLASLIWSFGLVALFGYVTGIETAYGWRQLPQMSVDAGTGFVVCVQELLTSLDSLRA